MKQLLTEINTLLKILTQEFVPELCVADWGEAELFILIVLGGTLLQLKAAVLGGAIRVARPQLLARPHLAPALRQGDAALGPGLLFHSPQRAPGYSSL